MEARTPPLHLRPPAFPGGSRRRPRPLAAAAAVIAVAASAVSAQPPPPPIFRASTDLVEIDVVARDRNGALVTDLTADDFTLLEDGRPQKIEIATLIRHAATAPGRTTSPGSDAAARPRVFVVVLDVEHLSTAGFARAQTTALTLLQHEFLDGSDLGGVVVGGQIANDRLTSNASELTAAVRAAKPNMEAEHAGLEFLEWPRLNDLEALRVAAGDRAVIGSVVARACHEEPEQCTDPRSPRDTEDDVRIKADRIATGLQAESSRTLAGLAALMSELSRVEGAKSVLLFSEGFAADESWDEVRQAIGVAAGANARIYALDVRGLAAAGGGVLEIAPQDATTRVLEALGGADDSINALASDTGGFVARNMNDMTAAMGAIAEEAGTYYAIGYRPRRAPDGTLRRVKVTVKRRGIATRSRRAYVATPALMARLAMPPQESAEPVDVVRPDPASLAAREYAQLVRQYASGDPAVGPALAAWPAERTRGAVARVAGVAEAIRRLFLELDALDQPRDRTKGDEQRREDRRRTLTARLGRAFDALDSGDVSALAKGTREPSARAAAEVEAALASATWRTGFPDALVVFLRAALGLHTAIAADAWRGDSPETIATQLEIGSVFVPDLLLRADPDLVGLWCRIGGALLTSSSQQPLALQHLDRCLSWLPDDGALWLARGSTVESASMAMRGLPPRETLRGWPRALGDPAVRERRIVSDYETALRRDPSLTEARVRLAYVLVGQRNQADAARAIAGLPEAMPAVPAFWAALIGAAAAEADLRIDDAEARYRAALAAYPNAQSAALALAHLLASDRGDPDRAASLLHDRLAPSADRTPPSDPWRFYALGQAWQAPEWLDEFVRRSRR